MPANGNRLRFRSLFPDLVAPWLQFQRGLLRVRWLLLLPIHIRIRWRPTWFLGAVAGTLAVMLTILLFAWPRPPRLPTVALPAVALPAVALPAVDIAPTLVPSADPVPSVELTPRPDIPPDWPTQSAVPVEPLPQPDPWAFASPQRPATARAEIVTRLSQTAMPQSWEQRSLLTLTSHKPVEPVPVDPRLALDAWNRTRLGQNAMPPEFRPYLARTDLPRPSFAPSVVVSSETVDVFDAPAAVRQPGIVVEKQVPEIAVRLQPLEYRLIVRNVGRDAVESVTVEERLSLLERVVSVDPPAAISSDGSLIWHLARMAPGEVRELSVRLLPDSLLSLSSQSAVEMLTRISTQTVVSSAPPPTETVKPPSPAPRTMPTPVVPTPIQPPPRQPMLPTSAWEPAAAPRPLPANLPPAEPAPLPRPRLTVRAVAEPFVRSGEVLSALYEIANSGTAPATNVVLTVRLSGELAHRYGPMVEHRIPHIAPGQIHRARLAARAIREGTAVLDARLVAADDTSLARVLQIRVQPASHPKSSAPCPPACPAPALAMSR